MLKLEKDFGKVAKMKRKKYLHGGEVPIFVRESD